MNRRRLTFGAAGVALLVVAVPATGDGPLGALETLAVETLGSDYTLVAAIGVLAVLVAVPVLVSGRSGNLDRTEMPDPEGPLEARTAGHEFDRTVHGWRFRLPVVGGSTRRRIRARLREAAVETVVAEGRRREEAERLVDTAAWTDDPAASAFLSSDARVIPASVRLRAWFDGETAPEYCADRTAAAIAARAEGGA